jgi:hypothetical protein
MRMLRFDRILMQIIARDVDHTIFHFAGIEISLRCFEDLIAVVAEPDQIRATLGSLKVIDGQEGNKDRQTFALVTALYREAL